MSLRLQSYLHKGACRSYWGAVAWGRGETDLKAARCCLGLGCGALPCSGAVVFAERDIACSGLEFDSESVYCRGTSMEA